MMRLPVNEKELAFLKAIGVADREYSREELEMIAEDTVADHLMTHGFQPGQADVNDTGRMCESIMDKIFTAIKA